MLPLILSLALAQNALPVGLPAPPEPIAGALVLVGGGAMPESIRSRFIELAGSEKARLVVIPTASADGDEAQKNLEPWKKAKIASVVLLHTRDRNQADDPAFVEPLTQATGVWLGGGDQKRLIDAYRGTRVEQELHRLLARGGAVGGTSAGAAVMSPIMIQGGTEAAQVGPGFGFLPGIVVDQHFLKRNRINRLLGVLKQNPGYAGLGIDEGTAVVVRGRAVSVLGDSFALTVLPASASKPVSIQALKQGDRADLVALCRAAIDRGGPTFPPEKPLSPRVEKGSLLIGGGGGMSLDIWKKFIELAGGPEVPIVVIPTALEDPVPSKPGELRALEKAGAKNVISLHTRSRKQADDPAFWQPLEKAGGVWFSGGRQWRFVDAYEGTATLRAIRGVLTRGGVIGGSSAGASIQTEYMPRGDPLGNTNIIAPGYERGFGFLPGVAVDQHFFARKRLADMTELIQAYPQLLGIGIDEGTVVVVRGGVMEVLGRSKVAVYNRRLPVMPGKPDYEEVPSGGRYDLVERKRLAP